jgi:hypothetical protein
LFPFLAGLTALVLIALVARRVLAPRAVPIAVGVVSLSDAMIYYTTADKQYAVDVLATVLVLLLAVVLSDRERDVRTTCIFAVVGAVAIWLSHSSVFVLAGVSAALAAGALVRRRWRAFAHVAVATAAWLTSFAAFALVSLGNVETVRRSLSDTPGALRGSGSSSLDVVLSGVRTSLGAFRYVTGIPHVGERGDYDAGQIAAVVAAAVCAVGFVSLVRRHAEKAAALVAPVAFMLIAWGLDRYPLLGRTQLFLVPIFALLLAEGAVTAATRLRRPGARAVIAIVAASIGVLIAAPALRHVVDPRQLNEVKPVLEHIAEHQRRGDTVYVYYTAQPQLRYYVDCGCAGPRFRMARSAGLWPLRRGPGGPDQWAPALESAPPRMIVSQYAGLRASSYGREFKALRGRKRVWVLIPEVEFSTRTNLLRELDLRGTRRATFAVGDVHDFATAVVVYLYDMTTRARRRQA